MYKYALVFVFAVFVSCKSSYTISPQSLKSQLLTSKFDSVAAHSYNEKGAYLGTNLEKLEVLNSKRQVIELNTSNPTKLKVTENNGSKFNYYLDAMGFLNDSISGMGPSFLVGGMIKEIHIDSITSIEVSQ